MLPALHIGENRIVMGNEIVQGWYPDPGKSGKLRWWDGARWTEHLQDAPAAAPADDVGAARAAGESPPQEVHPGPVATDVAPERSATGATTPAPGTGAGGPTPWEPCWPSPSSVRSLAGKRRTRPVAPSAPPHLQGPQARLRAQQPILHRPRRSRRWWLAFRPHQALFTARPSLSVGELQVSSKCKLMGGQLTTAASAHSHRGSGSRWVTT